MYKLVYTGACLDVLKFTRAWTILPGWGPSHGATEGSLASLRNQVRKLTREVKRQKGRGTPG